MLSLTLFYRACLFLTFAFPQLLSMEVLYILMFSLSGISRSAKGYCLISVLETMKTYSAEEGLTEEAVVTKLRICRYHHLYLHSSLRNNSSGLGLYSRATLLSWL